jgi:FkbM family methyltransferase
VRSTFRQLLTPGVKRAAARVLCDPFVGRLIGALYGDRIPLNGLRIHTGSPVVAARTKAEIYWGIYESAEIRFLSRFLRTDLDVIELGASLGVVSSHAARALEPGRRLLCVEANPHLIPLIEENLRANAPQREFRVVQRAIDYDAGRDAVRLALGVTTAASHVSSGQGTGGQEIVVPTATLSELLRESGFERYTLISDIEGAETGVFFDDPKALDGCGQILIELHDTQQNGGRLAYGDLAGEIERRYPFRVREAYGPVYVFDRVE